MTPAVITALFAIVLTASGCSATKLVPLDNQLNSDEAQLISARQSGRDTAPIQRQLAQVARDALHAATDSGNQKDAVAFYRVAAVAAWQAGGDGTTLVPQVSDAGIAACDALPQKDKDAPRDCSLIRMALPMSVQDEIALKLRDFRKRRAAAQQAHESHCRELQGTESAACRATRGKLPATDLAAEERMFTDLETQFSKVSEIRDGLRDLDVPPDFTMQTDAQRLIIYCNAVVAWRLTADTETGETLFNTLATRKAAIAQRLQESGVATNCAASDGSAVTRPAPIQDTTPPSM